MDDIQNPILANAGNESEASGAAADQQTAGGAQQPVSGEGQQPSQPQVEYLDFGGRKVPAVDESIRGLYQDWQHAQRMLQQLNWERQQYALQLQAYQAQLEALQAAQAGQAAQPQEAAQASSGPRGMTQEELEAFQERFYQDPAGALKEFLERDPYGVVSQRVQQIAEQQLAQYIQQQVQPLLEPVQQMQERAAWNEAVQSYRQMYPDFDQYAEALARMIDPAQGGNPNLVQTPADLRTLYLELKAANVNPADPTFQERIVSDPTWEPVRQRIVDSYLRTKQDQQASIPRTLGQPGGAQAVAPPNTPKSISEASRLFLQQLEGGAGS